MDMAKIVLAAVVETIARLSQTKIAQGGIYSRIGARWLHHGP
jgi:hypothetical protein